MLAVQTVFRSLRPYLLLAAGATVVALLAFGLSIAPLLLAS